MDEVISTLTCHKKQDLDIKNLLSATTQKPINKISIPRTRDEGSGQALKNLPRIQNPFRIKDQFDVAH